MRNTLPTSVSGLVAKSGVVIEALTNHGATLGLIRNTAATVTPNVTALLTADGSYKEKAAALRTSKLALQSVAASARRFGMRVRDSLKPSLGYVHSPVWAEIGFTTEFAVPLNPAKLKVLMLDIKAYLGRNPSAENAATGLTAVGAGDLSDQLTDGTDAVATAAYDAKNALTTRKNAAGTLSRCLRGVINELSEEIDPLSDYWVAFGFKKPGAKAAPGVPTNITAVLIGSSAVALKWDRPELAERFRIYKKVVGVDTEMVLVETREDLDFIIEGLPSGKTIQFAISAVNGAGESQLSEVKTVVTT